MALQYRTWTGSAIADTSPSNGWNPTNGYPPVTTPASGTTPAVYQGLTGTLICMVGTTADRMANIPNNVQKLRVQGQRFYDSTLGKLLVHDGYFWRDPATGLAA